MNDHPTEVLDLVTCNYTVYLATQHWANIRDQCLRRYNYKCAKCGSNRLVQAHHKDYSHRGRERPEDVISLCRSCHEAEHLQRLRQPI